MQGLSIQSAHSVYTVDFCSQISDLQTTLSTYRKKIFFVDSNVYQLHQNKLSRLIADSPLYRIEPTEEEKTLEGAKKIFDFLQAHNTDKSTILVVIGGGIIQDLLGFCAHLYYRGLEWILLPTTLLSMADSCIGAKSGLNLNQFKNQLGAFHAPSKIFICLDFIKTLDPLEIKSGYGEILKLHLISSWRDYQNLQEIILREGFSSKQLLELIRKSLATKKTYIEEDEFDRGVRRTLNYGHTFGHALELSSTDYIPHGLAVTWGMDLVNYISYQKSKLSYEKFIKIHELIQKQFLHGLRIQPDPDKLLEAVKRDKKVISQQVNLVLLTDDSSFVIETTNIDSELGKLTRDFINKYY